MESVSIQLRLGVAIVSREAFERQSACVFPDGFQWSGRICDVPWSSRAKSKTVYAVSVFNRSRTLRLHRLVMNTIPGQIVDHRDGNGLNCLESNLRITDFAGNARNRAKQPGTSSSFKGVSFHKLSGKWSAQVGFAGHQSHLGLFATEEEAALAYDDAASEHFGEFARLNFPHEHLTPATP